MKKNVKFCAVIIPLLLFSAGTFALRLNPGKVGKAAFCGYVICLAAVLTGICFFAAWAVLKAEAKKR